MKITKLMRASILLASSVLLTNASYAAAFAGNGTPTSYLVTVSAVEFHRTGDPANTFVSYASGAGSFDIASVSPGASVGVLTATGALPAGTYDQMRFTISKTMSLKGSSNGTLTNGVTCRTIAGASAISDPFGDGSVDTAYAGATDGATPTTESVVVPSGSAVTTPSDFTDLGSAFQATIPVDVTVTDIIPNVSVKFDVTDAIMFAPLGLSSCVVFPGPPTVNVTVA